MWIPVGALLFIVALVGSAAVVPRLRTLHVFQALLYVGVVLLARRGKPVGLGAATAVAMTWNALQIFVTHNMQAGARLLWAHVLTRSATRVDTMMVFVGGVGHFILMAACMSAFVASRPDGRAWRSFFAGGLAGLAYMVAIVAAFAPR